MVYLFATRNDPFLWLTGWSFATYTRFHRWIARIATLQAIIHSICYTFNSFWDDPTGADYAESWTEEYWYCGGLVCTPVCKLVAINAPNQISQATIVMSIMVGLSAWWFRARWYDLFLVGHIVFAIIFLVAMF